MKRMISEYYSNKNNSSSWIDKTKETGNMCGIVGFTGKHQAAPILLDGLSKLEYRGYDSAGIAVRDGENETEVIKAKGRLKVLIEKTNGGESVPGTCGIGHTRWATHGEPSETNAHPHVSDDGNVVAVHNGIIENYQELKEKLLRKGYTFYSATDTEVAVNLVDYYYKKYGKSPVEAVSHAMVRIRGSYALAMMFRDYPGEIFVARKDSPMILGVGDGESYIASDVPAILKYTRNVYYIGNLEMAHVKRGEITFYNLDGEEIEKEPKKIDWDAEAAEKAGYEHFMMKEIHEQPKAVSDTINSVVKDGKIDLSVWEWMKKRSGISARFILWPVDLHTMSAWQLSMFWKIWRVSRYVWSLHQSSVIVIQFWTKTALRSSSVNPERQQTALRHFVNAKPEESVPLPLSM